MIYSRWGDVVTIVRVATAEDYREMFGYAPDSTDQQHIQNKLSVVIKYPDDKLDVSLISFLRADEGLKEIQEAIERL